MYPLYFNGIKGLLTRLFGCWGLIYLLLLAGILSCTFQGMKRPKSDGLSAKGRVDQEASSIQNYIKLVSQSAPLKRPLYQLMVAQKLTEQFQFANALNFIEKLDYSLLPKDKLFSYSLLKAQLFSAVGDYKKALEALNFISYLSGTKRQGNLKFEPLKTSIRSLSVEQQDEWMLAKARYLKQLGFWIDAAYVFDARHYLLTSLQEKKDNQKYLWDCLNQLDITRIKALLGREKEVIFRGWLELVKINLDNSGGIAYQRDQYKKWKQKNPSHPASAEPPESILVLAPSIHRLPLRVGLMLPLSGPLAVAGEALGNGFLATYYFLLNQRYQVPELFFYDTATDPQREVQEQSMSLLYRQAMADQLDMIIGPLDKNRVREMQQLSLSIPVLALNSSVDKIATDVKTHAVEQNKNIIQFSLAVEDEAQQIVDKIIQAGHARLIILASDNNRGYRAMASFTEKWEFDQKGRGYWKRSVVDSNFVKESSSYVAQLEKLLLIDESKLRERRLSRLLGKKLEYTARRRQDFDALFLATSPEEARQIKPLLAFFFAQDVSVYGASSIYSGSPNIKLDNDINEVQFITMPWILDDKGVIKKAVTTNKTVSPQEMQFYAMGVDAFYLHQRLLQLQDSPQSGYHGAVGFLSVDDDNQVIKKLVWAKFSRGKPKLLRVSRSE